MSEEQRPDRQWLDQLMRESVQGFTAYCGFVPVSLEPGRFHARIELRPHHLQQDGFAHAGVVTTLADHTAGYAAYSLAERGRRILSVEFKINLLAPSDGTALECIAQVLKPGRRLIVVESEVFAVAPDQRTRVAKALLTMAAVPQERLPLPKFRPAVS